MKKILMALVVLVAAGAGWAAHSDGVSWGDSWVQTYLNVDTLTAKRGLGESWVNRGVSGTSSPACLARVITDIATYTPKVATLHIGLNDIYINSEWYLNDSLNKYVLNVRKIIDSCQAHACTVLVDMIPPVNRSGNYPTTLYNRHLTDLCISKNVKMANMYMPMIHRFSFGLQTEGIMDTLYSGDDLHPTKPAGITFYNNYATKYRLPLRESTFGHPDYLNMNYESWNSWKLTGATIVHDPDTGALAITTGQLAVGPVLCISTGYYYDSIVLPTRPSCSTFYRVSHAGFLSAELKPTWLHYTAPVRSKARFLQMKLKGISIDTINDLTIKYHKIDTETVFIKSNYDYFVPVTVNTAKNKSAATDFSTQVVLTTTNADFWNNVTANMSNVSIIDSLGNKLPRVLVTNVTGQKVIFNVAHNWANAKLRIAWGANNFDADDIRALGSTKPLYYLPFDDDSGRVIMHDICQRNMWDRGIPASGTKILSPFTGLIYRSALFRRAYKGDIKKYNGPNNQFFYFADPRLKPFTSLAILKRDSTGKAEAVWSKYDNPRGTVVRYLASDSLEVMLQSTATSSEIVIHTAANTSLDWQMLTVSYTGSSNAAGVRIWYDTIEQTKNVVTDNLTTTLQNGGLFSVGADYNASANTFSGYMSMFQFLETAVNDSFVKQSYYQFFQPDSVFSYGSILPDSSDWVVSSGNVTIPAGTPIVAEDVVFNNSGDTVFVAADLHVTGTFSCASDVVFVFTNGARIVMPDCTLGTTNGNTSVVLTYPEGCTSSRRRGGGSAIRIRINQRSHVGVRIR